MVEGMIAGSENEKDIRTFIDEVAKESKTARVTGDAGKGGVFTGKCAVNPVNGEAIPIWIADYVLMDYGTGAIMSVPTHDQRDFLFAKEHDLPMVSPAISFHPQIISTAGYLPPTAITALPHTRVGAS